MFLGYKELKEKVEDMERRYDKQFEVVFEIIHRLLDTDDEEPPRRIGFGVE